MLRGGIGRGRGGGAVVLIVGRHGVRRATWWGTRTTRFTGVVKGGGGRGGGVGRGVHGGIFGDGTQSVRVYAAQCGGVCVTACVLFFRWFLRAMRGFAHVSAIIIPPRSAPPFFFIPSSFFIACPSPLFFFLKFQAPHTHICMHLALPCTYTHVPYLNFTYRFDETSKTPVPPNIIKNSIPLHYTCTTTPANA